MRHLQRTLFKDRSLAALLILHHHQLSPDDVSGADEALDKAPARRNLVMPIVGVPVSRRRCVLCRVPLQGRLDALVSLALLALVPVQLSLLRQRASQNLQIGGLELLWVRRASGGVSTGVGLAVGLRLVLTITEKSRFCVSIDESLAVAVLVLD